MENKKKCKGICGETLPITEFSIVNKKYRHGKCKACRAKEANTKNAKNAKSKSVRIDDDLFNTVMGNW